MDEQKALYCPVGGAMRADGEVAGEMRYYPFGEVRTASGSMWTDQLFTGQRALLDLGIYHYNARFYSPYLKRFLSADTVVPGAAQSQAYDRYAYVTNSPLMYADPSGHWGCKPGLDGGNCTGANPNNGPKESNQPPGPCFYQLPVNTSDMVGVQWFGRTLRAAELKQVHADNIYQYCQWAHCGLDLLAEYGTPVYAGVYGVVVSVFSIENGKTWPWEGTYRIQIEVGDYVITYGHTDGTAFVERGQFVTPNTIISGVGNMGGNPSSNQIDHIHLEIRGPGGWGGLSQNPLQYMSDTLVQDLIDIATNQQAEVSMGRFWDGVNTYIYTNDVFMNPPAYSRNPNVPFPYD